MWCKDGVTKVLRAFGFASTVSVSVNVFFTGDLVDCKIDVLGLSLNTASEIHFFLGAVLVRETVGGRVNLYGKYQCDPCFRWRHADWSEYLHVFNQDSQFRC